MTDDYAAVRTEMESVAQALGKNVLREVSYEEFFAALPELTGRVNDRAILRAIHFFNENKRVEKAKCLYSKKSNRAKTFFGTCNQQRTS